MFLCLHLLFLYPFLSLHSHLPAQLPSLLDLKLLEIGFSVLMRAAFQET